MQTNTFEEFYGNVCKSMGVDQEPLRRDEMGWSFAVNTLGVQTTVFHSEYRSNDCALVMVNLGLPRPHQEQEALNDLLEANFSWITQEHHMVGARHALTGELFIQFAYPLAGAHPADLLARIEGIAVWCEGWEHYVGPRQSPADEAASGLSATETIQ